MERRGAPWWCWQRWLRIVGVVSIGATLAACGGGGGGGGAGSAAPPGQGSPTPVPTPIPDPVPVVAAPATTAITLQSETGDTLGLGRSYGYSPANAEVTVAIRAKLLTVTVVGDEDWTGEFQIPDSASWQPARYDNAAIYKPSVPNVAAMRWYGSGRGCTSATGWFAIDQVDRADAYGLRSLILRFARYCDGASAAMKGEVRFQVNDSTSPAPVAAAPADLWRPPAGSTPASGNYVYLSSDAGDVVGLNRSRLYTPDDTRIYGTGSSDFFEVSLAGHERWYGILNGRKAVRLVAGYYPELVRYPFANPTRGGLSWVGDGRGCRDARGWAVIDRVEYDPLPGNSVKAIEYRFEQTCVGAAGALRGAVRWSADAAAPPASATSPGSWRPPAGSTPASGNYAYLSSSAGDFLAVGRTALFTPLDSVIGLVEKQGDVAIDINGDDRWFINLQAQGLGVPLVAGVYDKLGGASPGGGAPYFSAASNSRGCKAQTWLAVDEASYVAGQLTALRLRFESWCEGSTGPLRGELRWSAGDARLPAGPAADVPATLWRPQPGSIPSGTQNYLRVESSRADFVGAGLSATYTQATAGLSVSAADNRLHLEVAGDEAWTADFAGPAGQARLVPGFYAGLLRYPLHNPARGRLEVSSDARGGNELQGWFVVDRISYSAAGQLTDLGLRFEQHASGSTPGGLWGELRWAAGDITQPPGPVAAPADLWRPAVGSTPASGNFLYFESVGDPIGSGTTQTLTAANAKLSLSQGKVGATATFTADVGGYFPWTAEFKTMSSLSRLQPGFYGGIYGHRFQNPAKGGLSFSGDGHGCNVISGWFVVDDVRYGGEDIVALKIRFEQVCDGSGVLRGQLSWAQ